MNMITYASMVRGINIGGKKVKMDRLKEIYRSLDFKNVKTYIQSGNVIFESKKSDPTKLSHIIEKRIAKIFEFEVKVFLRTKNEMEQVLSGNPFKQEDLNHIYVTFLSDIPSEMLIKDLNRISTVDMVNKSDKYIISKKEIYLFLPNGYERTKLNNNFFEKKLDISATTRNWRTVSNIVDIASNK